MSKRRIEELDDLLVKVLQEIAANKQLQLTQVQDRNKALRVSIIVKLIIFGKMNFLVGP